MSCYGRRSRSARFRSGCAGRAGRSCQGIWHWTETELELVYTKYYSGTQLIEQNGWLKSDFEAGNIDYFQWAPTNVLTRDGYVFLGWSYMGSDAIIDFDVTRAPNTNQSLVAHWKAVDPQTVTHKVTFSDGLEATEDAVVEVEDGKTVARPGDPVFEGYKFLGWTLDKETMELFDFATPVTADMTLYGVWQKVAAAEPGADEGANGNAGVENGKTEGQSAAQGEAAKADEAKVTDLPQTSDSGMMVAGVAAAAGVAALGAGAFALRRRNAQR